MFIPINEAFEILWPRRIDFWKNDIVIASKKTELKLK